MVYRVDWGPPNSPVGPPNKLGTRNPGFFYLQLNFKMIFALMLRIFVDSAFGVLIQRGFLAQGISSTRKFPHSPKSGTAGFGKVGRGSFLKIVLV